MSFCIGDKVQVKSDAEDVKPEFRGLKCTIIRITGSIKPFHYLVKINKKDYLFRGDELQKIG